MATFKICVFKHQKRKDGKYPVSIRIYWKNQHSYIKTEYYVKLDQISQRKGAFELNNVFISNELNRRIEDFERLKIELGKRIYNYSAKQLAEYFESTLTEKDNTIDFLQFGFRYCDQRKQDGKSYQRIVTTLRNLQDFCKGKLPIKELTSKKLIEFEKYLKSERKITRINQHGNPVTTHQKPCSIHCIADYMSDIRTVFNAALLEYNDDDNSVITHYPFRKYKVPHIPETPKRNLTPEQIRSIAEFQPTTARSVIAKDVFLLSFYLVGMNTADIYNLKPEDYSQGRITYNRQKTKSVRSDKAKISIAVLPQTAEMINRYIDPQKKKLLWFAQKYSTFQIFVSNVNKGLKIIAAALNLPADLSTYYARHSWATIARNDLNFETALVSECLNHKVPELKMADIYIKKDWSRIDKVNSAVIDYIFRATFVQNNGENSIKNLSDFHNKKAETL